MLCKKCGANIGDGDLFCGECGAAVTTIKSETTSTICEKCGNPLHGGELFCGECGTPVKKTEKSLYEENSKNCPYCGAVCSNDSEFCGECGKSLNTYSTEKINSLYEAEPTVDSMISSVPSHESISGGIKSTMKTTDKPIDYEEEAEKKQGNSFFEMPGDLE